MPTNPNPNPVIVVPGITATGLRDEYPVDAQRVWVPTSQMAGDFARIALHPIDPRAGADMGLPLYEAVEPARVVPDEIFGLVYRELVEELRHDLGSRETGPVPVYPFGYDWRQALADTQVVFAEFVQEVIDRTSLMPGYRNTPWADNPTVDLVGHSMGGLIIAGYLADWPNDHRVARIATLGTPFRGSVEALLKLATGEGSVGGERVAQREREMSRLLPAVYHLLPDYDRVLCDTHDQPCDPFQLSSMQWGTMASIATAYQRLAPEITPAEDAAAATLKRMLDAAREHRRITNNPRLLQRAGLTPNDWLCIAGVDEKTRVRAIGKRHGEWTRYDLDSMEKRNRWSASKDDEQRKETGDGTVPLRAAIPGFLDEANIVCITDDDIPWIRGMGDRALEAGIGLHGSLPAMGMAQRLILSHLKLQNGKRGLPFGRVRGSRIPGVENWNPPITNLEER